MLVTIATVYLRMLVVGSLGAAVESGVVTPAYLLQGRVAGILLLVLNAWLWLEGIISMF